MKKYTLTLLLTAAPLFAGTPAPVAPAPQYNSEQGWTLGLEAMLLRPFQSSGGYDQSNYDFAGRGSLGYQFADGLFVKATYFGYGTDIVDQSVITPPSITNETNGYLDQYSGRMSASYIDLVIGQNFKPTETLKLSPYVGLRWAMFQEGYTDTTTTPYPGTARTTTYYAGRNDFEGLGIVVGIDATRALGSNFSIYGTAKETVAFGTSTYASTGYAENSGDSVVSISELGLGLQYDFCFSNVAANVRLGVEGQWWAGVSGASSIMSSGSGSSQNVGLAGFVLGANFRF